MMRAHVIENSTVVNTIEVDYLDFMENLVEATEGSIGWSYADGVFTAPSDNTTPEERSQSIRSRRDSLLAQCDWTQLPDAPADSAAWAVYRQELRDITAQGGFPENVVWPTQPE